MNGIIKSLFLQLAIRLYGRSSAFELQIAPGPFFRTPTKCQRRVQLYRTIQYRGWTLRGIPLEEYANKKGGCAGDAAESQILLRASQPNYNTEVWQHNGLASRLETPAINTAWHSWLIVNLSSEGKP